MPPRSVWSPSRAVGVQLAGRLLGNAGAARPAAYRFVILSLNEICGFAGDGELQRSPARSSPARISASPVLGLFGEPTRRIVEIWAFGFTAAASGYMTYQLVNFAWVSLRFHEVSNGVIRVPLALPQAAMALGALMLTVALIDELVIVLRGGRPTFRKAEDAISLGKEG
jgi:hypothetical protein